MNVRMRLFASATDSALNVGTLGRGLSRALDAA